MCLSIWTELEGGGQTPNEPELKGVIDTTMDWIYKTWSGTYKYGIKRASMVHKVYGKLRRNGQTKDVEIIYNAPPFDTSVVVIRY